VKSCFKTKSAPNSIGCANYDQPAVNFKRKILQFIKARKNESSLFVAGRLFHVNQIRDRAGIGVVSHCWEVFVDRFETGIDGLLLEGVETSDQAANQVPDRFARKRRSQTGSGLQRDARRRRGEAHRSFAENRVLVIDWVSDRLTLHGVRGRTLAEARNFIVDFSRLKHGAWNRSHRALVALLGPTRVELQIWCGK